MSAKDKLIVKLVMDNERLNDEVLKWIADYNQLEMRAYALQDDAERARQELDNQLRGEAITYEPEEFGPRGSEFNPDDFVAKLAEDNAKKEVK
jgi:outer membrane murein-binding lipoprotein Lpp